MCESILGDEIILGNPLSFTGQKYRDENIKKPLLSVCTKPALAKRFDNYINDEFKTFCVLRPAFIFRQISWIFLQHYSSVLWSSLSALNSCTKHTACLTGLDAAFRLSQV